MQRHATPRHQSEENGISQIHYREWKSNPQPVTFKVTLCTPTPQQAFSSNKFFLYKDTEPILILYSIFYNDLTLHCE